MAGRVAQLVGDRRARAMWVMTFHSACVRILRREAARFGYPSNFSIYDSADSQRLMALVCRELELDARQYPPKSMAAQVSNLKNELEDYESFAARARGAREKALAEAYAEYQRRLVAAGAMDFDDLIMVTVNLFQAFPDVAAAYRRRFRHVLVDEYQDTNHAQYVLVRELVSGGDSLFGSRTDPAGSGGPTEPDPGRRTLRAVRRRRRGPVDLRVPRRHDQEHHRVRAGLPERDRDPARAELPLHPEHPRRGERGGVEELGPQAEEPLVRGGRRPADRRLRREQRARRGGVRRRGGRPAERRGPGDPRPGGGLLPDERPVPCLRGNLHPGRAAVPGRRRRPVLRAARGPRPPRLPAADRQPGRRGLAAAGAERAQARHRRPGGGVRGRVRVPRADLVRPGAADARRRFRPWRPGRRRPSPGSTRSSTICASRPRPAARWPSWSRRCSTAPVIRRRSRPPRTCRT